MIHGVDVSAYQSETYSIAGLDFVIVKSTEGLTYTNPRLGAQTKRARDAGLVVGFYHYPHMGNDPIAEASYFLQRTPLEPGDLVVFDWEGYDAANKGVPRSRQITYRDAWLKYVKSRLPDHRVGMYCNTDYWLNVDKTGNCGDFLWIATGGKPAGQPGIKAKWTFHQYSTAGGIDHDVADFDSRAALAAWANGIEEEPMGLSDDDIVKVGRQVVTGANGMKNPSDSTKDWALSSFVGLTYKATLTIAADVAAVKKKVDTLTVGGVDLDALADKVADKLAARLAD